MTTQLASTDSGTDVRPRAPERHIAVLCFLPDLGHILPALRFARRLAIRSGARVTAFLAPRFQRAAAEHGIAFRPLAAFADIEHGVLTELSRRSHFYNEFTDYQDLLDRYWAPLFRSLTRELPSLAAGLRSERPDLVIADSHIFDRQYRMLAAACGARLVLHRACGSQYPHHRTFVRCYGLSELSGWAQRAVEIAGALNVRAARRWRRWLHPERVRATAASEAALEETARALFGEPPPLGPEPLRVSAGTCVIEGRVATPRRAEDLARELLLPPRIEASAPLPDALTRWLEQQTRPVVYVSFGSMVAPRGRMLRRLARGLDQAGVAVVWAQPSAQRASLAGEGLPAERFRFEEFVPQAALLASGRIACFVTHAGAASVQEALSAGVPMLAVPFVWDQPYMASVVERLGCGRRLRHRRLGPRKVETAVRKILADGCYAERARALAAELRGMPEESVLPAELVEGLLAPP